MLELSGVWRAHVADDELRRAFADLAFDDSQWSELHVPGHWRSDPAFAANDAPVLHRRAFEAGPPPEGRRAWVTFSGLFYQGDVWLDGAYLGDTEGYFAAHSFEISDQLRDRSEHVLALELACSPQNDRKAKRNLTGVFQHWDCIHPDWNPGGIWRDVIVHETGPVRIEKLRVLCLEASSERAVLLVRAQLDALEARQVRLRTRVGETLHEQDRPIAAGSNRVEWQVTVERPRLWWPHSLGAQTLTDVHLEVIEPTDGSISDERRRTTGLRQVRMRNWIFEINGERMHMKGANLGPTRMAIASATADELKRDMTLAREAGLDFVRLHAHISHPAIYTAADELGVLLWQDLPLQWGYARSVRKQAIRQAREAVDALGHHPSIFHWCGHNEPLALDIDPELASGSPKRAAEMIGRYLALQELPTWNKSVLDFGIHRALTKADPSRPVTAHSGVLPGPTSGGTDSHLYFGWYHGNERDLPKLLGRFPRMARFVSEFGAQAVPVDAAFCEPTRWPDLDWDRLGHDHALQKVFFDRTVAPGAYATFDEWRAATQEHQAVVLRRHIEELRRIKYRPNGGFALFSLADALDHPAVTWSILGHDRQPKQAYEAVQEACRPVIVTIDRPPAIVSAGDTLALDVHVVSDVRHVLRSVLVTATARWPGGTHAWRWQGDVAADDCTRVGALDIVVPTITPATDGELAIDLTLEHPEATATNRYTSRLV